MINLDTYESFSISEILTPDSHDDSLDLRGCRVLDQHHEVIGVITDIYCNAEDLTAKYVEISLFRDKNENTYFYPFDLVVWKNEGVAQLSSTKEALVSFHQYDPEYVFNHVAEQLIPYNDALELGLDVPEPECLVGTTAA